jgi:hypothetical protein
MTTTVTLTGLTTTIFADEGFDEVLKQVGAVTGDCWMVGRKVVKVVAPDGIEFSGPSGRLIRPDGFNVTDICDLEQLARDIAASKAERDELALDGQPF